MFVERLENMTRALSQARIVPVAGYVTEVRENMLYAVVQGGKIGALYEIDSASNDKVLGEIVAIRQGYVVLSALGKTTGVIQGARVSKVSEMLTVTLSDDLLGRVVDPFLKPLHGPERSVDSSTQKGVKETPESAMHRPMISEPFVTGVRVIDGLTTLGVGQRIAILGPPGTGKSSLMGMLAQQCHADVVVIALVGERSREVREFYDDVLPSNLRSKVVIVASTSSTSASERALCGFTATTVAEYFRDQGLSVLLMVDSLTRTARALREIGLAAGEPPTRRGYPASVYSVLPTLIERAGRTQRGDITAIYTVLTEGEITNDPVAEEVKSLTDGHIILSRELAEMGHYPAIDALKSLSRSMPRVVTKRHVKSAADIRGLLAKYEDVEMLLQLGEYTPGQDQHADRAVKNYDAIQLFLKQKPNEEAAYQTLVSTLEALTK